MTCPACGGTLLDGHPAGMVYRHTLTCPLGRAEDTTRAADQQRGGTVRPVTSAERSLLAAQDHHLPADAEVRVTFLTLGLRHRAFPAAIPTTHPDHPDHQEDTP